MVVGFGATQVIDGVLTVGGLAACTMLAGRSMQPLQKAVGLWTRFQNIRLARDRVAKIFEMEEESPRGLPRLPDVQGGLELRNLHFGYGKNSYGEEYAELLTDINLKVEPGETIGISGGNASGKTTLLYLMMTALKPTSGQALVDGNDLAGFDPVSVRSQLAYLPQEAVLFNGTILENITMFRPEYDNDALDMAKLLGLDNVVAHMPVGYDTMVGGGSGDSLPRGIKQRIAIARAIVHRPRILLFDEANTAMDGAGDTLLRGLLEKLQGRVTLIMVTHRPSMLSLADRIYDLEGGFLTERDPNAGQGRPQLPKPASPPAVSKPRGVTA